VRQGEKAAGYIYVPLGTSKTAEDNEDAAEGKRESLRFTLVPVFDVTQTQELEAAASVAA